MACGHSLAPELSRNPRTSVQRIGPVSVNHFCQKQSPLSIKQEAQLPHGQPTKLLYPEMVRVLARIRECHTPCK